MDFAIVQLIMFVESAVGFVARLGVPAKLAELLIKSIFFYLVLLFTKTVMTKKFGDSRAIKIFIYGFGGVMYLTLILGLFID